MITLKREVEELKRRVSELESREIKLSEPRVVELEWTEFYVDRTVDCGLWECDNIFDDLHAVYFKYKCTCGHDEENWVYVKDVSDEKATYECCQCSEKVTLHFKGFSENLAALEPWERGEEWYVGHSDMGKHGSVRDAVRVLITWPTKKLENAIFHKQRLADDWSDIGLRGIQTAVDAILAERKKNEGE